MSKVKTKDTSYLNNQPVIEEKNLTKVFEDFFTNNNLVFYKRKNKNSTIFLLPYHITDKKIKVTIRVVTFTKHSLCRMSFTQKLNTSRDFSKELLEINSELLNGSLSVAPNSNNVSFSINFVLNESKDLDVIYKDNLFICFSVLMTLYNKHIIDKSIEDFNED